MQEDLDIITSWEHWPSMMRLFRQLSGDEWVVLSALGLGFMGRWSRIQAHTTMMIVLVETWDGETCTFHLLTS